MSPVRFRGGTRRHGGKLISPHKRATLINTDIANRRLYNQYLSHPDFETPAAVVRWFGAVQAQDLLSSLYGISLRMPAATEQLVEQAIAEKTIVRTWPMRST